MLKFIKDATNAVKTKNENLRIINETNNEIKKAKEEIEDANKELKETQLRLKETEKKIESIEKQHHKISNELLQKEQSLSKIIVEEKVKLKYKDFLDQEIQHLSRQLKEMKLEVDELETEILYLLEEREFIKDPVLEKKKGIARLCSTLRQVSEKMESSGRTWSFEKELIAYPTQFIYPYNPYGKLLESPNEKENNYYLFGNKTEEKNVTIEEWVDELFDSLLYNFAKSYDKTFDLVIPTVLDYLYEFIDQGSVNDFRWNSENISYANIRGQMQNFYEEHMITFLTLLTKKGYPVKGYEKEILLLLKKKALEINYENLKDEFYLLDHLNSVDYSLEDVLSYYIQIAGSQNIRYFTKLAFLSEFLINKGFGNFEKELLEEDDLLKMAEEDYNLMKLEKELAEENPVEEKEVITLEKINDMSGDEFEQFLANLLKKIGFRTTVTKGSGDQGVDIVAKKQGKTYAIQAKRYSGAVGNKAVQEVVSGKEYYGADASWVITNSHFTQAAINLASKTNTLLWDGNKLKSVLDIANI
ncbi:restriction endonuclease [Ureibacillus sp. NPDC094379]